VVAGAAVRIRVIDDGVGFDAVRLPRALAQRAEAIGASIAVQSRPGHTVVQVDFA
jgi:signal transduction histidine kinase